MKKWWDRKDYFPFEKGPSSGDMWISRWLNSMLSVAPLLAPGKWVDSGWNPQLLGWGHLQKYLRPALSISWKPRHTTPKGFAWIMWQSMADLDLKVYTCNIEETKKTHLKILLIVQKSGKHQLRLVLEIPLFTTGFIHPRWLLRISSINSILLDP